MLPTAHTATSSSASSTALPRHRTRADDAPEGATLARRPRSPPPGRARPSTAAALVEPHQRLAPLASRKYPATPRPRSSTVLSTGAVRSTGAVTSAGAGHVAQGVESGRRPRGDTHTHLFGGSRFESGTVPQPWVATSPSRQVGMPGRCERLHHTRRGSRDGARVTGSFRRSGITSGNAQGRHRCPPPPPPGARCCAVPGPCSSPPCSSVPPRARRPGRPHGRPDRGGEPHGIRLGDGHARCEPVGRGEPHRQPVGHHVADPHQPGPVAERHGHRNQPPLRRRRPRPARASRSTGGRRGPPPRPPSSPAPWPTVATTTSTRAAPSSMAATPSTASSR